MRRGLAAAVVVCACSFIAHAETAFPTYDIEKFCRTQAEYSYAATLGDSSFEGVYAMCKDREGEDRSEVLALWPKTPAKLAVECLGLADGRYSYLKRCVAGAREMRTAR